MTLAFLSRSLRGLALTGFFVATVAGVLAEDIHVADFGAVANDGLDDSPALRKAADAARQKPGSRLIFAPGRYHLKAGLMRGYSVLFQECRDLTVEGNGAELVGSDAASLLVFSKCQNLTVRDFSVDWEPLPFTGGKVVGVGEHSFDLEISPPHTVQPGRRVAAFTEYDPVRSRLAQSGLETYQSDFTEPADAVGTGTLRCFVKGQPPKLGTAQIVRYGIYSANAVTLQRCRQVVLERLNIYAAPGMGVYGDGCTGVSLSKVNVRIRPGSSRWMSTTADATHFNNCRGSVAYADCLFEGMGDDAINLHSMYMVLSEKAGSRELTVTAGRKGTAVPVPEAGDTLEFLSPETLLPVFTGIVKSATPGKGQSTVQLEADLPEGVTAGYVVGNASTCVSARIRRCRVLRNRARGFLIQTRAVEIEDCVFEDVSGAAIHLTCDANYWWEGQSVREVLIRGCRFERCNYGVARRVGVIDLFAEIGKAAAPAGVHRGIRIENNEFVENEGAAIHVSSAEEVGIRGNRVEKSTRALTLLDHCRKVQLSGNIFPEGSSLSVEWGTEVERESVLIEGEAAP